MITDIPPARHPPLASPRLPSPHSPGTRGGDLAEAVEKAARVLHHAVQIRVHVRVLVQFAFVKLRAREAEQDKQSVAEAE